MRTRARQEKGRDSREGNSQNADVAWKQAHPDFTHPSFTGGGWLIVKRM